MLPRSHYLVHPVSSKYLKARPCFLIFSRLDSHDSDGRLLLEVRSFNWKPDHKDYKFCRYGDSRKRNIHLMNSAALKQYVKNRENISRRVASLSKIIGSQTQSLSQLQLLNIFGYIGYRAISFWIVKASISPWWNLRKFTVPSEISTLSKFCHGIVTLTWSILTTESCPTCSADLHNISSASSLLDYAQKNGLLIGESEVCAAPQLLIHQLISDIISPDTGAIPVDPFDICLAEHCKIVHDIEIVSMLFATLRLKVCNYLIHNLLAPNESLLSSVPAISYFDICKEMSKMELPLMHKFFKMIEMPYWQGSNEELRFLREEFKEVFAKGNSDLESGLLSRADWINFKTKFLHMINKLNEDLAKQQLIKRRCKVINSADLDVFFGRDPYSCVPLDN